MSIRGIRFRVEEEPKRREANLYMDTGLVAPITVAFLSLILSSVGLIFCRDWDYGSVFSARSAPLCRAYPNRFDDWLAGFLPASAAQDLLWTPPIARKFPRSGRNDRLAVKDPTMFEKWKMCHDI